MNPGKGETDAPPSGDLFCAEDAKPKKPSRVKKTTRDLTGEQRVQFDEAWRNYPLKVSKRASEMAFAAALTRADFATILNGVLRYAAQRTGQDPKFTKHFSTWLNGDCWTDEPSPAPPQADRTVSQANGRPRRMSATEQVLNMLKGRADG